MNKRIAIGMAIVLLLGLVMNIGPAQAQEPDPSTPGAWRIYPDGTQEYFGNDRYAKTWGNPDIDHYTSIHGALGYSGRYLCPGPDNDDICYWEFYNPPPEGSIIELRGPGVWEIGGDGAQGGLGREKQKSLVVQQNSITIRGQNYDPGDGSSVQQEIFFNNGATTALFYLEASDLTIENLHISGTWPSNSGGYALAVGRYTMIGPDANATGLTVQDCTFTDLRAPFDQRPIVKDLTVIDNTVDNHRYNFFKYGAYFEGDNTITGNTFINPLQDKSEPYIHILDNSGTTLIDDNTFNGWKSGYYAIQGKADPGLTAPIDLGCESNVFVDQLGGSGAIYELYGLTSGGHAVGLYSEGDVIFSCGPPAPRVVKQDVLAALSALDPTGDKKTDKAIEKAIEHIQKSLNIDPKHPEKEPKHELWLDDDHLDPKHGKKVFDEEKKAVHELMKIDAPDVSGAIDALVSADKILAQTAIDEAIAAAAAVGCGEESNDPECKKTLEEIAKAQNEMAKAQEELDHTKKDGTPDPKYDKAIDHYKKAWEHAQKAMK